ncbi:MAG: hypothetical protein E4G91_11010 [Candidatus Zixiibacteriota bacterium]|nr:MAG: hypothetical protein E4G91_11010 [candidate division Zixibacteria bacterium]
MAKRGKKRIKHRDGTASKIGKQVQSSSPIRRVKNKRYAIWSICGILVALAAVVAWTVLKSDSPRTTESTSVVKSQAELPAESLETTKSDPVPDTMVSAPRLTIPETEFDFGFAPQAGKISHDFWLYSEGNDTLKILQVNPG